MEIYQTRIIAEKSELDSKREKLAEFTRTEMFRSLPEQEMKLFVRQAVFMELYSDTLAERIALFHD